MSVTRETEAATLRACLDYLKLVGALAIRANSGAVKVGGRFVRFNSAKGCSDILACLAGRWVSVEVKAPDGRLTPDQGEFLDDVRRAGGVALCVRSVAELAAALTAEGFDV